ncbi:MAG TPA: thioredoxin domain-containing protein [Candidatus Acidoferrales bacterium]|nr:thioredoxin domain-containing protein [Candidatus Acidoferrales bacterium]
MIHRRNTLLGTNSRSWRARPVARTRALWAVLFMGLGIATLAGAQSATTPAKPAASATAHAHKTAATKPVASLGAPVKAYGASSAPITMEVFSDYECPSCRNLFETTLRPMIADYVAAGKVYLVHRDFPLPMHKYGYQAARWLNASARVGQFQEVEAALYDNQNAWAQDGSIEKYVSGAMSAADFKRVQSQMQGCEMPGTASVKPARLALGGQTGDTCSLDTYIDQDRALGNKIPVQATPTYVISYKGNHLPAGSGSVSWPILKQFFDSLLSQ